MKKLVILSVLFLNMVVHLNAAAHELNGFYKGEVRGCKIQILIDIQGDSMFLGPKANASMIRCPNRGSDSYLWDEFTINGNEIWQTSGADEWYLGTISNNKINIEFDAYAPDLYEKFDLELDSDDPQFLKFYFVRKGVAPISMRALLVRQ